MLSEGVVAERARIRLFGAFELRGPDGGGVAIASQKGRGLLAYLLMAHGCAAGRERLGGLLWSDSAEAQARMSLRQCLRELRSALAPLASRWGLDPLETDRDVIRLNAEAVGCDWWDLRAALAGEDASAVAAALEAAGERTFLDDLRVSGLFEEWLIHTRAQVEQTIGRAVQGHIDRLSAAARWSEVTRLAEALLARDPLNEAAAAAAIRADIAGGAQGAAHRRYRILRGELARVLGVGPGALVEEALATLGRSSPPGLAGSAPVPAAEPTVEARSAPFAPPLVIVAAFGAVGGSPAPHPELATTLRDEIVAGLSRFRDLRVVLDPRPLDAVAADGFAADAGDYILGASIGASLGDPSAPASQAVRFSARLLSLDARRVVWSETFQVSGAAMVETIDATIGRTVGAVLPRIDADLLDRPSRLPSDSAYGRYLRGREAAYGARTDAQARAAAAELEAMIAAQPGFVLPYLPLAYLYNTDLGGTRALSSDDAAWDRALDLAKQALALDRGHAHAYTVAGWCYLRRRQWEPARAHLAQALAINPFHASRVMEVGYGLLFLGEVEQAGALMDRCLLLNPEPRDNFFSDLGLLAFMAGDGERAASWFCLIAELDVWAALYKAMNATILGGDAARERREATARLAAIWPADPPLEVEAAVAWMARHHPFRAPDMERRFLDAARRTLALGLAEAKGLLTSSSGEVETRQ